MEINELIEHITKNLKAYGITLYRGATFYEIESFERELNLTLPHDIKTFYQFCNGFESEEDLFRIIPLDEIIDRKEDFKPNKFYIAEYLIYCDMWTIEINEIENDKYIISNKGEKYRQLTSSFANFINRFLSGGVFEKGGLYQWHEEVDRLNG